MMKKQTEKQIRAELARLQAQLAALEIQENTRDGINAMTGRKIKVAKDISWSCSPESEAYWCS